MITNYTDLSDPIWTVKIGFNPSLSFNTKTPSLSKNHTEFSLYMSLNQPFSVKINGIFASLNKFIYVQGGPKSMYIALRAMKIKHIKF